MLRRGSAWCDGAAEHHVTSRLAGADEGCGPESQAPQRKAGHDTALGGRASRDFKQGVDMIRCAL